MKRITQLVVGMALVACLFSMLSPKAYADPKVYVCDVKQVFVITDKGTVGKSEWTKMVSGSLKRFTFDERTGELRWAGTNSVITFEVRQLGNEGYHMNAIIEVYPGGAVDSVLRINTYLDTWTFIWDDPHSTISGVCS